MLIMLEAVPPVRRNLGVGQPRDVAARERRGGVCRWGLVFGDDQMAAAVIDRIVHHGRLIQFRGEPYRVRHALMREGSCSEMWPNESCIKGALIGVSRDAATDTRRYTGDRQT